MTIVQFAFSHNAPVSEQRARYPYLLPSTTSQVTAPLEPAAESGGTLLTIKVGMRASAKDNVFYAGAEPPQHSAYKNRRDHPLRRNERLAKERHRLTLLV